MIDNLEDQLRRDEGERLAAYQDHLGYWTIGVGILIDGRKGGGITRDESTYLLRNRIAKSEATLTEALPWLANLDPVRKAALLNMAFQMGVAGLLGFKRSLASVRDGRYAQAASEFLESLWAKQTPKRAFRIARQIETGEWQ